MALLAVAMWVGSRDRDDRGLAQEPHPAGAAQTTFHVAQTDVPYDGDVWTTIYVAASGDPTAPPGLDHFPQPGEVWVSPAVRDALDTDTSSASRVPGSITGTISAAGLQSPDQLLVYVARTSAGRTWYSADGWGENADVAGRPTVPSFVVLALILGLAGMPALLLQRAVARGAVLARGLSMRRLFRLGVSRRTLSWAAATDAVWCGLTGFVVALPVAAAAVLLSQPDAVLGLSWFPPPTVLPLIPSAVVAACLLGGVAIVAARGSAERVAAIAGDDRGPLPLRAWRRVPFVAGTALLLGIVVPGALTGHGHASGAVWALYLGAPLALVGGVLILPEVVGRLGDTLGSRARGVGAHLALKRVGWDRDALAAAGAGLLVAVTCAWLAAGVVTDLGATSTAGPLGYQYSVTFPVAEDDSVRAVASIPAVTRVLLNGPPRHRTATGTCEDLSRSLGAVDAGAGDALAAVCVPNSVFKVVPLGRPETADRIAIGGSDTWRLVGTRIVAADPSTVEEPLRDPELLVHPADDLDGYFSAVMGQAPLATVANIEASTYLPMIAPTQRLLVATSAMGAAAGLVLWWLSTAGEGDRFSRYHMRLSAVGHTRAPALHFWGQAFAGAVTLVFATWVGWLVAEAYTVIGGLGRSPWHLGLVVTATAASALMMALAGGLVAARRRSHEPPRYPTAD
ncbi:hypothetical protein [Nocardioides bruguierae]|uniref:hypothetical protein n=1 Tax=Nocardioides bruguierae TaxID=2945102 RepID=UPI002020066F|nr:hypothetical protein [Nocardioides bruguierae]MCL8026905.1 hypothetical protein [Nocardioides bruguierae]